MKLLLIIGLTVALPFLVYSANDQCHTSEIMKCLDIGIEWYTSQPERTIPTTEEDVEVMCSEMEKAFACARKWLDKCLTPMQKEVVDLAVEGLEEFRFEFCKKGSLQRKNYLDHSECLSKVAKMDEVKDAMQYILAVIERLADVENSKKATYVCCGYAKGYGSIISLVEKNCDPETVQAEREFTKMIFAQLPDVVCNGFKGDEDKCVEVLPPNGSKPTDKLKGTAMYDYFKKAFKNWIDEERK